MLSLLCVRNDYFHGFNNLVLRVFDIILLDNFAIIKIVIVAIIILLWSFSLLTCLTTVWTHFLFCFIYVVHSDLNYANLWNMYAIMFALNFVFVGFFWEKHDFITLRSSIDFKFHFAIEYRRSYCCWIR